MVELRENEQRTLRALKKLSGKGNVDRILNASGLVHAAVMRAALALQEKGLIEIHESKQSIITLSEEGKRYAEKGLPEKRLIQSLIKLGGEAPVEEAVEKAQLDKKITPLRAEDLSEQMQKAAAALKKRRLVQIDEKILRELELTDSGWRQVKRGIDLVQEVSQLTPELIITGKWRKVSLRKFDVTAPGPVAYPGKVHPLQQIIQMVRDAFLEMGFTEIRGPIVQTAFWNFDALFQPQDHPAREMMDTFYLSHPEKGGLPKKETVEKVAQTHENGWITGSRGWEYNWSPDEARRLILRTHTTAVTIRYLAEHNKPPVKVFSVDRIYRNEKVDYKHLAELHQIEGIVMDKDVTLQDLLGTLKEFYLKLGLEKVKFWPSYFPYTEPSSQAMFYVPKLKTWVELCGMGLFRPEVLAPFGIDYPVLAWGGGLERLAMIKLGLSDIRYLYKNDLGWIRRTPLCPR